MEKTKCDTQEKPHSKEACASFLRPIKDSLEVLSGKWKLQILSSLMFGNKRFGQISKELNGVTDKVLSKELKELETNHLVKRTVYDTFPPTVEYSITEHGKSLKSVLGELNRWGTKHRKKIIG